MKKFKRILFGFLGFLGAQCISGAIGLAFYHFFSSYGLEIKVLVFVLYLVISSAIITILDQIRRTIAVDKPLNDILNACDKISKGDFNIKLVHSSEYSDNTTVDIIKDHINYMAIELSKSKVMKNDFISNVSHEIKTPLAGIQSYVRLLQNDKLSVDERNKYLDNLNNLCVNLSNLVTNILKLNKLENNKIILDIKEINLGSFLQDKLVAFIDKIDSKNITLNLDIEDNVIFKTDESYMEIVFNNLISNAVKFTDNLGEISISLVKDEKSIVFRITDTGCGMSKETGEHIFDKFYQGDSSHHREGNGLGLALVKQVIDTIGGSIDVESTLGVGSTFTVILMEEYIGW